MLWFIWELMHLEYALLFLWYCGTIRRKTAVPRAQRCWGKLSSLVTENKIFIFPEKLLLMLILHTIPECLQGFLGGCRKCQRVAEKASLRGLSGKAGIVDGPQETEISVLGIESSAFRRRLERVRKSKEEASPGISRWNPVARCQLSEYWAPVSLPQNSHQLLGVVDGSYDLACASGPYSFHCPRCSSGQVSGERCWRCQALHGSGVMSTVFLPQRTRDKRPIALGWEERRDRGICSFSFVVVVASGGRDWV